MLEPQAREAHRGTQFEHLGALLPADCECLVKARFDLGDRVCGCETTFSLDPAQFCFPVFLSRPLCPFPRFETGCYSPPDFARAGMKLGYQARVIGGVINLAP